MSYVPNTQADRDAMLAALGLESIDPLFAEIPAALRQPSIHIPAAASEIELRRELTSLAGRNIDLRQRSCFLGAGLYRHYIPSVVAHILGRGEFYTAYTPYQPEVSQGVLQATYEFQTLVCQLTGMEVANASMYDGASALAEAALMAAAITGRSRVAVAASVHPEHREVLRTYTQGIDLDIVTFDDDSAVEGSELVPADVLDDTTAAVLVQNPSFFGTLVDLNALAAQAHKAGSLMVVSVDPISLGILKPPGEYGADITVAEGQPLGNELNFGGPLLGLLATRMEFVRRMPGRIVGATTDSRGRQGFVLTLQTREQHIRREKATSNICTNEALNALAAAVYLSTLGPEGLRQVATLCAQKAHYAADRILSLRGFQPLFSRPFFKEFAVRCPVPPDEINKGLSQRGIIGGCPLARAYPKLADSMLFCVTELNTRQEIDELVQSLDEICETQ